MTENVALFKPTWQKYNGFGNTMGPDLAVDGRYSNLSADGGECTVTSLLTFRFTAEWRVDLGKVFSIHHIFIQYMTNNEPWGNIYFLHVKVNFDSQIKYVYYGQYSA